MSGYYSVRCILLLHSFTTYVSSNFVLVFVFRTPEQVFIWWTAESPGSFVFMKHNLDDYDNFFNWTMTYRRDSDVTAPYNTAHDLYKTIEMGQNAIDDIISKKEKLSVSPNILS